MIELISRSTALENDVFATFIHNWQQRFDPRIDPYMTEPGIYYDNLTDQDRFYTGEEINKIRQEEVEEFERRSDPIMPGKFEYTGELLYCLPYTDIIVYAIEIGKVLENLSAYTNAKTTFLLDYRIPWLHQQNEYPPVNSALNYLREEGVSEDFVGGIRADGKRLEELSKNLFWIIRCNASLPYCWFSCGYESFVGNICKHGNIHLYTYGEAVKEKLIAFASQNGLIEIKECLQGFTDSRSIDGRELLV